MAIAPFELKRLIHVLGMTDSNGDGEALNAIRLANKIRKANGLTWEDLLGHGLKPPPPAEPSYRTPPPQQDWMQRSQQTRAQQEWDAAIRNLDEAIQRGRMSADARRAEQRANTDRLREQAQQRAEDRARERDLQQPRQPPHGGRR